MKIEIVTLFPRMIAGALEYGVVGRAIERGLLRSGPRIRARTRRMRTVRSTTGPTGAVRAW